MEARYAAPAMSEELTFRDFAAAVMGNDLAKASSVLEVLLGLQPAAAGAATQRFHEQMSASPAFMMKAMGLRPVVESGDAARLRELLAELFGCEGGALETAVATVRSRYPS
jgi:hypothetical protein